MSDELRVAVLGAGAMGSFHVEALARRTPGARVAVVVDVDPERARRAAEPVGARVVTEDPHRAIEDVDAVVVATPVPDHVAAVTACLDTGRPVLCEKPLAGTAGDADAIVRREAALGRRLVQVGFMRRFDREYAAARAVIAEGGLSVPLMMHCVHRNRDVPDRFDSATMIGESAVHEVDAARFLLGEEIAAVRVIAGRATPGAPQGVADPLLLVLETDSGAVVTVENFVRTGVAYEVRAEVVGAEDTITLGADAMVATATGMRLPADFVERFAPAYDAELRAWVGAARRGIATGGDAVDGPGALDGAAAAAVCDAALTSLRTGERQALTHG